MPVSTEGQLTNETKKLSLGDFYSSDEVQVTFDNGAILTHREVQPHDTIYLKELLKKNKVEDGEILDMCAVAMTFIKIEKNGQTYHFPEIKTFQNVLDRTKIPYKDYTEVMKSLAKLSGIEENIEQLKK